MYDEFIEKSPYYIFGRIMFVLVAVSRTCTSPTEAMNVLAIETITGKSHWNFMSALLRALTDNGHRVTAFTPYPDGERINYTEVDIADEISAVDRDIDSPSYVLENFRRSAVMIPLVVNMTRYVCDVIYANARMKEVLAGGPEGRGPYDLIITERVASECVTYAAATLNVPVVFSAPSPMKTTIEHSVTGDAPNPATVSHVMAYHSVPRTFVQRFANTVFFAYSVFLNERKECELKATDPSDYDLAAPVKPSIVFVNTHDISEAPRPFPANVVQVGGIHLRPPDGIPEDVLEYIDDSPHGVIFFTFGSVVQMSTLPVRIQNVCKEALARVPQRILWKYDGEMPNKPTNVMTRKWFPQREILLHPKVKLFISHGGISGVYEAVDAGVPVLGLPVFYDQPRNVENLVDAGMAISMDLLSVTRDDFLNAVNELIYNEKYRQNAKLASERFKDRPMTPAESVVYWTEYVIRHNGAPHLKSIAFNMPWYQYYNLDVIAVMSTTVLAAFYIVYKTLQMCIRKFYDYSRLRQIKVKTT